MTIFIIAPELPVLRHPGLQLLERLGPQRVQAFQPVGPHLDEPRLVEDPQVARDPRLVELAALDDVVHRLLAAQQRLDDPAARLAPWLEDPRYPNGYVLITRSQKADLRAEGLLPPGALDTIEGALRRSPAFAVEFENRDAVVFRLARSGTPK